MTTPADHTPINRGKYIGKTPSDVAERDYFWTTQEVAILHEHYAALGPAYCHQKLPHRTRAAVQAQAGALGLKAPRNGNEGKRFARIYPNEDRIDLMVREGYAASKKRGDIEALAQRIGRPNWWVQKRATVLGITRGAAKPTLWSAEEFAIVERSAVCTLQTIRKRLKKAGYARSDCAIAMQLKRLKMVRREPGTFNAMELAELLGVHRDTIANWVESRGLKAARAAQGGYAIRERDIRAWFKQTREQFVDLRRVDQREFWILMFGVA